MRPCIIAASRPWYDGIANRLALKTQRQFYQIVKPEEFTSKWLEKINPEYVFFPHWSWIIPDEIWMHYECVVFHMTDLPLGRGGSPLQNLILQGNTETKISAIRCIKELDAGPIYCKSPLSLHGSAQEIFLRAIPIVEEMICKIVKEKVVPCPQVGKHTIFTRRRPEQSDISNLASLNDVYDYIRMLDAEGYPHAFLQYGNLRFEFRNSIFVNGRLKADVEITICEQEDG